MNATTTPAADPASGFFARFRNEANIWNRYSEFKVERTTTEKLDGLLNDIAEDHMYLDGGEPNVTPAENGFEVISVTHVGGRDWVVILGNVGA